MVGRWQLKTHLCGSGAGVKWGWHVARSVKPIYAVLVGRSIGDGAWRGLVTIVESIDPRPCNFTTPLHVSLIYTVIYERPSINSSKSASPFPPPFPIGVDVCTHGIRRSSLWVSDSIPECDTLQSYNPLLY